MRRPTSTHFRTYSNICCCNRFHDLHFPMAWRGYVIGCECSHLWCSLGRSCILHCTCAKCTAMFVDDDHPAVRKMSAPKHLRVRDLARMRRAHV